MVRELLNVLSVVRPRHLLKAVLHPMVEFQAFQYHYRRVSEEEFVGFLAPSGAEPPSWPSRERDLEALSEFAGRLDERLSPNPAAFSQRMYEARAVYVLARLLRPRSIVETGVADGRTSAIILRALEENRQGRLHSIDIPYPDLPAGKDPGWLVPEALRHRWDLRLGPSRELLPALLDEIGPIDWFIHDSLHTYENMIFELRAAWPSLLPGGLVLADDIGRHAAFLDFVAEAGLRWSDWRAYEDLGGFRVPASRHREPAR